MQITASAISLNVPDVRASAEWAATHLGFSEVMSAEGFCSLSHPDAGFNLIYLRTGLPTFKPASAAGPADGLLVVFTVEDMTRTTRDSRTSESRSSPRSRPSRGVSATSRWPTRTGSSTSSSSGSSRRTRHTPDELWGNTPDRRGGGGRRRTLVQQQDERGDEDGDELVVGHVRRRRRWA